MSAGLKRLPAFFWRSGSGSEPVRDWLRNELDEDDRYEVGTAIKTVEYAWPLGLPVCRHLDKGVWEVRVTLPRNRIARVLFCIHQRQMVLLHGFIKKTQGTPRREIDLALVRKRGL